MTIDGRPFLSAQRAAEGLDGINRGQRRGRIGHPSTRMARQDVFHAVEGVIGRLQALIFARTAGLLGPLGLFQLIRDDLEPGGQPDLVMLEILPGRFGADLPATSIRQQMQPVVGAFGLELGIRVHPGHRTGVPASGHALDLLHPAEDGAIGVELGGIGDVAVVGHLIEDERFPGRGDGHHDRGAIRPSVCTQDDRPLGVHAERGACHRGRRAELRMRLVVEQPISPLIVIHAPHEIAQLPEIGNGEFFAREQGPVAVHRGLIEAIGVDGGRNGAFTDPVGELGVVMAVVVKDADPGTVRGGGKDGIAFPHPEVLGDGGKAFDAGKLIGFAVDIGIHLFALERLGAFPAAGFKPRPVLQFEPEPPIFGPILQGQGRLIQSPLGTEGFEEILELGGAHIVFIAHEIDTRIRHRPEGRRPETGSGRFPRFIRPQLRHDLGPSMDTGRLPQPDALAVGLTGIDSVRGVWRDDFIGQLVAIGGRPPRRLMDKRDKVHLSAEELPELGDEPVAQWDRDGGDGTHGCST